VFVISYCQLYCQDLLIWSLFDLGTFIRSNFLLKFDDITLYNNNNNNNNINTG